MGAGHSASLASGTATFAAGATFAYEVDSTNPLSLAAAADLLVVTGDLTLDPGNGTLLTFADIASSPNAFVEDTTIFALVNYSGSWNGGLFTYGSNVLADGERFTVGSQVWEIDYNRTSSAGLDNFTADYLPSSNFVTVTAVPEPAALALAGISAALAAAAYRHRKTPRLRRGGPTTRGVGLVRLPCPRRPGSPHGVGLLRPPSHRCPGSTHA